MKIRGVKRIMTVKKIGLDRCRFVLDTIAIDFGKYRGNIEKGERAKVVDMRTGEVIGISDLNLDIKGIATDNTDNYRVKLELMKKPQVAFVLDVNIPKLLYNSNERNVSNLEHLNQVNEIIENKLREHGIHTDMKQARVSSIEVNINSNDPKLYDCFKLIRKGLLENNNKVFQVENKNRYESLMIKNSYLKLKVYDKVQQLSDTQQLVDNKALIRIEISTRHKKILDILSNDSATLEGIISNWDGLEKWFIDTINKQIKKPCDKFCDLVVDDMVEKLKQGYRTYDVLFEQAHKGNIVDLDLFDVAMKKYYKEVGKSKPHTIIKNTKKRLEKMDKQQYDSLVGNKVALDKLWHDLGLK